MGNRPEAYFIQIIVLPTILAAMSTTEPWPTSKTTTEYSTTTTSDTTPTSLTTTESSTIGTTESTTMEITAESTSYESTTIETTSESTTSETSSESTTMQTTTESSTIEPTSDSTTNESTTKQTTAESTIIETTAESITIEPTDNSTTNESTTTQTTAESTTIEPTADSATNESTTIEATAESTVTDKTTESTTNKSTSIETSTESAITTNPETTSTSPPTTRSSTVITSHTIHTPQTIEPTYPTTSDPNQCLSKPCQNGAACVDKVEDFLCVCREGFSGKTCKQKVSLPPKVIPHKVDVFPDRGPEAGGTNLTITLISGIREVQAVLLSLHGHSYKECRILDRNGKTVIAKTSPNDANVKAEVILLITANNANITWNTGHTFLYKPNPEITNIQPNTTLLGGGTKLTVSGASIDSVAHPMITFGVMHCFAIDQQAKFIEACKLNQSDTMFCFTPNVSVCNTTRSGSSRAVRSASSSSDADKDNKKMVLSILGFILDGDTNYDNLSKHADLPNRLEAYEPPVLTKLESTLQYQKGVPLEIKGEHMARGVTIGDYTVHVGKGICLTTNHSLTASVLLCIPPEPIPERSNDSSSKYHRIMVKIGNYDYDYGYIWYPWWFNKMIIIPAAVVGGLFIIVITLTIIIVKVQKKKQESKNKRDSTMLLSPVMSEEMEQAINRGEIVLPRIRMENLDRQNLDRRWHTGNHQDQFMMDDMVTTGLSYLDDSSIIKQYHQDNAEYRGNDIEDIYLHQWPTNVRQSDALYANLTNSRNSMNKIHGRMSREYINFRVTRQSAREEAARHDPDNTPLPSAIPTRSSRLQQFFDNDNYTLERDHLALGRELPHFSHDTKITPSYKRGPFNYKHF